MNETLLREHAKSNEEFHEQRRRKRNALDSEGIQTKRSDNNAGMRNPRALPQVTTRNYSAPLRTQMEIEGTKEDTHNDGVNEQQQEPPSQTGRQAGRPSPVVLTTESNLIQLQKQLTELVKGNF
jgi:hypothetical protein